MYLVSAERDWVKAVLPQHSLGVCVLDFMQEGFQDTGPGDFENIFIKAWDSETKEGLRIKEAPSQQQE